MRIAFRFRLVPFIATVLLVALGITLGQWQDRRAAGKIAIEQTLEARAKAGPVAVGAAALAMGDVEYAKVKVTGEFVRGWPLFLDNRPLKGRAGFYLLMPLKIAGSNMHVLVARGWLPRHSAERDRLPPFDTPQGTVTIEGVAKSSMGHIMQLGTAPALKPGAIVQNVDLAQFGAASGLALQPFFIEQAGASAPGEMLVRDWPAPSLGVEKHQGYAFQWYALAVMALLFFVLTGFRRGNK
jgi:surfeit locus 1 family protein